MFVRYVFKLGSYGQEVSMPFFLSKKLVNTNFFKKGANILKHFNVRSKLIESTIKVIARDGLDKTTTKAIAKESDLHEAYIYQHFENKEKLLAQTFDVLDEELATTAMQNVEVMYMQNLNYEARCRFFFSAVWHFIIGNREKCMAFIQYYYSPYFKKYSENGHTKRYIPLVEKFCDAFKAESNVWMILNHILNVMLDFAVKIFNDAVSNSDDTAEHVFRLIFCSVKQYFKSEN